MNIPASLFGTAATITLLSVFNVPARDGIQIDPDPPASLYSPTESMAKIKVPEGFKLELVAAEPLIEEPVCMAWGPDGELYVAEMRSYMQDIDMGGELKPVSRVVKLVDTDGDGRMDQATTYLDNLVLPRAILTLDNKVLIGEPPHLWLCEDTNGDGTADTKVSIYENFGKRDSGNVEHKINGLQWTMDNWIYNTKTATSFRYRNETIEERRVVFAGQWGQTTNDRGENIATKNSDPGQATIFPGKYLGDSPLANRYRNLFERIRLGKGYATTWPIQGTPDTQGGPGLNRADDRSLQRFTGACGQVVFRGDRLGEDMKGTYWVCEPVGRMIRCSDVAYKDGLITLHNRLEQQEQEFIASTDANFRPVNAYTGPDGTLHFIDMYRGIIQHGNWTREGSYLREEILRRGLEKNIGKGRIYRLIRQDIKPGPMPRFSKADSKALVEALGHPNGWWRDEAQKLLVLRGEADAIPLLKDAVKQAESGLARAHALWTLEGLGVWDETLVTQAIADTHMDVRLAALRVTGEHILEHPVSDALLEAVSTPLPDDDLDIAAQRLLTLSCFKKQAREFTVRSGHIERVLQAAGTFIDQDLIAKAFMVALNPAETIPALERISRDSRFRRKVHPLPQHLAFAGFAQADAEQLAALIDFTARVHAALRDAILEGFRLGSKAGKAVPGDLVRFSTKPTGITSMEEAGVSEYSLAILYDHITWPGDPKFNLKKALPPLSESELARFNKGREIYQGLCMACHGPDGEGMKMPEPQNELMMAPALAGSPRVINNNHRFFAEIMLKGLTGPIDGVTYGGVMAPMEAYDNEWLASVMTYVRRSWGNGASPVHPNDIEKVRGWHKKRTTPFTLATLNFPSPKSKPKEEKKIETQPEKSSSVVRDAPLAKKQEPKRDTSAPKGGWVPPTAEELKKVEAAIPDTLPAKPKKDRKLLVYSLSHGFKHNSRLIGEEMLKLIEKKTGAFELTINNDATKWTSGYLKQFDAIAVLNATSLHGGFKDENRQAFLDFVYNGGGLFGCHAATDGGKKHWPEYSALWGGAFGGHPWGKTGNWLIKNYDPDHVLNQPFKSQGFWINDELYRQTHPYKKGNVHTLTGIDLAEKKNTHNPNGNIKTVPPDIDRKPGEPKPANVPLDLNRDYPTSWCKKAGKGRVFYATFGHNESAYWNPAIVEHYLRGLQYALGDLDANDVPDR